MDSKTRASGTGQITGGRKAPSRVPASPFVLRLDFVLYVLIAFHISAAFYSPIADCDETYQYWEPTHYLNHSYGLQSWETSPEYAIRSWAYIAIHAIPAKIGGLFMTSKTSEFYFLRCVLALFCAAAEQRLYSAISRNLNPRIGALYLIALIASPGVWQASVAFLPSSFAMMTSSLGLASFIDWRGSKTATGIMWFGIGALLGWPFAAVLIVPFMIEELAMAFVSGDIPEIGSRILDGVVRCLIVLALQVAIDAFFYHRATIVPLNIVLYNVFSGKDRGPNIFGTEPWTFYVRNLLLNYNIWSVLAIAVAPLLFLQTMLRHEKTTKQTVLRTCVLITPFYIWLVIFGTQAHKEERFMYPVIPFLCLNGAIAFHIILSYLGSSNPKGLIGRVPGQAKAGIMLFVVLASVNVGLLRSIGIVTAYRAPLQIYQALEGAGMARRGDTVCFGKDWYRFPTSYFLPNGMRPKFINSEFSGLLPGEFSEAQVGFGLFSGTWLMPPGMNDKNEEDPGKYADIKHCSYLVDTHFPSMNPTKLEPDYSADTLTWEKVSCVPLLDAGSTSLLPRTIWFPNLPIVPEGFRRKWGEHCLLRRR